MTVFPFKKAKIRDILKKQKTPLSKLMHLKFLGAAREVTGSKHLLEVNGKKIFLDYGMLQGQRSETYARNLATLIDPQEIDAVILSHAHIDHSGNLPILVKKGYRGPIFSTFATKDLCSYMLRDCAYIQEKEIEYLNKKLQKKGQKDLLEALYTLPDAENTLKYFQRKVYDSEFPVVPGVTAIFRDAGHILGSATVTLTIDDQQSGKKHVLIYTGDLGRKSLPILRDPVFIKQADILITESTYGNRLHETIEDIDGKVAAIVNRTAGRGGKIIIPAFALGRTQEVVYTIHKLMHEKAIPDLPIFVDSPLACSVTEVFRNHPECFDRDTYLNFLDKNEDPFGFYRLKYTHSVEDSKKLNTINSPCIIISASGMCEHGRILHHLRNNVENPRNTVLIVGYQAENTLGRKIVERRKIIKIFGQPYRLKAEVCIVDAFSAHADRNDLLEFAGKIAGLKKVFVVHGEAKQTESFAEALRAQGIPDVKVPASGENIKL